MIKLENGMTVKPVFAESCVPVCFSANNSYIPQTAVMIKSIIENGTDARNYDFIILSTDIDDKNERNLLSFADGHNNVSIRIIDISSMLENVKFFTESVYTPTTYSKEAYFRLFIPFAMPDYEKVIYFDGDMVAVSDIAPLIDIDMNDCIAAATRDYCGIAACYDDTSGRREYRQEIGIRDMDRYFISSMVVVNIPKLNELYTLDDLKVLISSRKWRQHDQDIFNVLCQDKLLIVDAKWSFFEEYDYSLRFLPQYLKDELMKASLEPVVIHYAAANKAWQDERSALTKHFWKYAALTPYFDEFFDKINKDSVSFRYHTYKSAKGGKIEYCNAPIGLMLVAAPYFLGYINNLKAVVERIEITDGSVFVEGCYECVDEFGTLLLTARLNGKPVNVQCSSEPRKYGQYSGIKPIKEFSISFEIDKYSENVLELAFSFDGEKTYSPYYVSVEQFAPINEYGYSFYSKDDVILTKREGKYLVFEPYSRKKVLYLNKQICKHLRSHKTRYFTKMAIVRSLYYATKPLFRHKNICLISDTRSSVDEATIKLAESMSERENIKPYLVVARNAEGVDAARGRVNVVFAQSKKHKFLFLHARSLVLSDYYMPFALPLYSRSNEIRDMVANKRIIYWHKGGDDMLSIDKAWHNVYKFITASPEHYEKMLELDNGYNKDDVCLVSGGDNSEICSIIAKNVKRN